jgi:hypothetical protein
MSRIIIRINSIAILSSADQLFARAQNRPVNSACKVRFDGALVASPTKRSTNPNYRAFRAKSADRRDIF